MEQSWSRVLPRVSGTSLKTKRAAMAQTIPWKKKRKWRPSELITVGTW